MQGKGDYVYNHKYAINQISSAEDEKKDPIFSTKHTKKLEEREGYFKETS